MVRKWLLLLFLAAFIAGGLYQVEERLQLFRLRNLDIQPSAILPNAMVWRRIPQTARRFWPLLLLQREGLLKLLEEQVPVTASLSLAGWGDFRLKITPLVPWFMVFWKGSEWYLSIDGRMWSVHHNMNNVILQQEPREGPILIWTETMYDLVSSSTGRVPLDRVMASQAPLRKLKSWKENLEELGFYDRIDSMSVRQKDGELFLELLLRRSPKAVRILVPALSGEWENLLTAVDEILEQTGAVERDLYIDATYSGKILVRTDPGQ
ncbi:MAG: hypothetical protein ACP5DY_00955 [Thermovirgaceae bacterium]